MKCDKICIHYPCTRTECGKNIECYYYKSAIDSAIEIIDKCKGDQNVQD